MNTQDSNDETHINPDHLVEHPTDEQLTEQEREAMEEAHQMRESYDEKADLRERVEAKMQLLADNPGLEVEFDPDEAEHIGLFEEDAMSFEDAWEARFDEQV